MQLLWQHPALAQLLSPYREQLLEAWRRLEITHGDAARSTWSITVGTLETLLTISADKATMMAALLFDLSVTPTISDDWKNVLGHRQPFIRRLLEGQLAAQTVWELHTRGLKKHNPEGLTRLLLSLVGDLRVVLILLARQLATLREAAKLPLKSRRELAALTQDIHCPLANRLGIWQFKWELEDLAFRHLNPETYHQIASSLDERRVQRETYITNAIEQLQDALVAHNLQAQVNGRPKHLYSIWRKMQKKQLAFAQLYDLHALRVIVDHLDACYVALGIVHTIWSPIPSEFDDYIARPKVNHYRSLHTTVIGPGQRPIEVQIRTLQMHQQAELGVAAHWKYKEGGPSTDTAFDRKIYEMRQTLQQVQEGDNSQEDVGFDSDLAQDRVYALTPQGEVIDLPCGATPLDFAYHVHTMIGHRCRGAKVNSRIVPLTFRLRSADRVEILTSPQANPRRDWLVPAHGFLVSSRARDRVRAWFHKQDRLRQLQLGKDLLERELRRQGLLATDPNEIVRKLHLDSTSDLYVQVASGDLRPNQICRLLSSVSPPASKRLPAKRRKTTDNSQRSADSGQQYFTVQGQHNFLVQRAGCCQPIADEAIVGYLTRGRGVSVHRPACPDFQRLASRCDPNRLVSVEWAKHDAKFDVTISLQAVDRRWLLKDITNVIAQEEAYVLAVNTETQRRPEHVKLRFRLRIINHQQLVGLLAKLSAVPGVDDVQRIG